MKIVLFRLIVVWIIIHIILLLVETYRYERSNLSWYCFKNDGMLDITYGILFIDIIIISTATIMGIGYWVLQPII